MGCESSEPSHFPLSISLFGIGAGEASRLCDFFKCKNKVWATIALIFRADLTHGAAKRATPRQRRPDPQRGWRLTPTRLRAPNRAPLENLGTPPLSLVVTPSPVLLLLCERMPGSSDDAQATTFAEDVEVEESSGDDEFSFDVDDVDGAMYDSEEDEDEDEHFHDAEEGPSEGADADEADEDGARDGPCTRSRTNARTKRAGSDPSGNGASSTSKQEQEDLAQRQESYERLRGILQAHVGWAENSKGDMASLIRRREAMGHWSPSKRTRVSSRVLPNGEPEVVDLGNSRAYIGHFAEDGNVFVAGFQNQTIRLYDVNQTDAPWRLRKEIVARSLNWTITDTCLSPNQQLLVYATISPVLHVVNINATDNVRSIQNITDLHTPLDFRQGFSDGAFGLWAITFSSDGKHILAGSTDYATYLYDIEAQRVVSRAHAHKVSTQAKGEAPWRRRNPFCLTD